MGVIGLMPAAYTHHKWTYDEEKHLITNWQPWRTPAAHIAEKLGLPIKAVLARIHKYRRRPWSDRDDAYLINHAQTDHITDLAVYLKRTIDAIRCHTLELGIMRRYEKDGWFTAADIAVIMDVTEPWVLERVRRGIIPCRNGNGHNQHRHITYDDIKRYLRTCPMDVQGLIDAGRKVDMVTLIDILAGVLPAPSSQEERGTKLNGYNRGNGNKTD